MRQILLIILFSALCLPFAAQETAKVDKATTLSVAGNDLRAIAILKKIEEKHQTIQRIVASFKQLKYSKIFLETIESEGTLRYIKPNKLMIEYIPPLFNYIIDDVFWIYNPEIEQAERFDMSQGDSQGVRINQNLLGFGASVDELEKEFKIEWIEATPKGKAGITFTPLPKIQNRIFKKCDLFILEKELRPETLIIFDDQDDVTSITIQRVIWNEPIDPKLFKLEFPADTEIIKRN